MTKEIQVTVENKLVKEKRDLNVYRNFKRSAHMISHNSSITLPLRPVLDDDYLHISVVAGPGQLEHKSIINLPAWADFEFSFEGKITVSHSGNRTVLNVPPGPPLWQLKMTRSASVIDYQQDRVIVGDDQVNPT